MPSHCKIGIIEDNTRLLQNYIEFFQLQENYIISFAYESIDAFINEFNPATGITPNVILLDVNLPGINGIEGIEMLKSCFPEVVIIMLTAYSNKEHILRAIEKGASGYLLKGMSLFEIKSTIDGYYSGGAPVSPIVTRTIIDHLNKAGSNKNNIQEDLTIREKEIVKCLTDGLSYKETGKRLGIATSTVNQHLKSIYIKMQVNSKAELISKILKSRYL